jgi:hypothetical protein
VPHKSHLVAPPLSNLAVAPTISSENGPSSQSGPPNNVTTLRKDGQVKPRIRAAAAQIIFAARNSREFITPEDVIHTEEWCGRSVLEALIGLEIAPEVIITRLLNDARARLLTCISISGFMRMKEVYGPDRHLARGRDVCSNSLYCYPTWRLSLTLLYFLVFLWSFKQIKLHAGKVCYVRKRHKK